MSNRVTLEQMTQMRVGEIAALPIDQLAMLIDDADALATKAKTYKDWLHGALTIRYGDRAKEARAAIGKDSGTVHVFEGGYDVVYDLPGKPKWNQAQLEQAVTTLQHAWGEDPKEYVGFEIKVPERKYKAWPSKIRNLFEPARTMELGKPSFKLQRKEAA